MTSPEDPKIEKTILGQNSLSRRDLSFETHLVFFDFFFAWEIGAPIFLGVGGRRIDSENSNSTVERKSNRKRK